MMSNMNAISHDEQLVVMSPCTHTGYSQEWRQDRNATASLRSGILLPGFTPKQ
jgi:hypothetical protein